MPCPAMTSTGEETRPTPVRRLGPGGGVATGRVVIAVLFWLAVWQVASMAIAQDLLLVSPVDVLATLLTQVQTAPFWSSVAYSFVRIVGGFLLALAAGTLLAGLAGHSAVARTLLAPLVLVIKSVPVVSFIILVLIWASSGSLSVVISFLIALPVVYTNVLEGIDQRDPKLLEMAQVFRIPPWRRWRAIDVPAVLPYLQSGSRIAIGLAWKSGVAAEVIGLPQGSIGEQLYQSKIFLSTAELFSWTLVIVLLAFAFERAFLFALRAASDRIRDWGE